MAVIAAGLLLPKTGELVLLDEFCDLSVIWIVCAYLVIRVVRNRTLLSASRKALGAGVVMEAASHQELFQTNSCNKKFDRQNKI